MKNNIINGYDNLQHNLIDLIREEEAKLGYRKENIKDEYPYYKGRVPACQ